MTRDSDNYPCAWCIFLYSDDEAICDECRSEEDHDCSDDTEEVLNENGELVGYRCRICGEEEPKPIMSFLITPLGIHGSDGSFSDNPECEY